MAYFTKADAQDYAQIAKNSQMNIGKVLDLIVETCGPHPSNLPRFRRRAEAVLRDEMAKLGYYPDLVNADMAVLEARAIGGVLSAAEDERMALVGDTFLFTCAQANTYLNDAFWASLMAMKANYGAELHVSRFTYNKAAFGQSKAAKPDTGDQSDGDDMWFDPRILPFVSDNDLTITDDLIWAGGLNIIPTRIDPINGFENYGRGASVIIPHVKMAMRSVPTMKHQDARFAYTTGTVTQRNYIERAAGQKASLHHVYGALLVEVSKDRKSWWVRQINADNDGVIYDMDNKFMPDGTATYHNRVEIITHGDLHGYKFNSDIAPAIGALIDRLEPRNQVFHDVIDFQPRNHHNINDPNFLYQMHLEGKSVSGEFDRTAGWLLHLFHRSSCKHYIVTSNHDQAIEGWLRNTAAFFDAPNREFWLEGNLEVTKAIKNGQKPRPFARAITRALKLVIASANAEALPLDFKIVDEDESLMIAGIENGLHGHLGPNGARGNPKNLRTVGKANTGHTHSAGITDGVYTAGVLGNLDMGYNKGLSGWSHSSILTYPNGKRAIVTLSGNAFSRELHDEIGD